MKSVPKQRVSQVFPLGAPTGGIDDTSSIAGMDPSYALEVSNFYVEAGALAVRWGYQEHVTGMTDNGKTLMVFNAQDGSSELFCCTDDGIFDITSSTDTPTNVHALTDGTVVWTQFSNIAGQWLIGCNGVDAAFIYDGTTWTSMSNTGAPANPGEITTGGIAVADIVYVHVHKNRIWFIEKNTMSAWYWPLNAVSGATTEFPLGGIFSKAGYLNSMFSWTMDSGVGVDDILVFQSSRGELGGYEGIDPSSASDWQLLARYFIGAPLGRKTAIPLNGDILLLTEFGIVSLFNVINGTYRLGSIDSVISAKISRTLNELVRSRGGAPGWEMISSPAFQYVVLSIPEFVGFAPYQFVMNSITKAWSTFDLPAITIYEYGNNLYFTDDGGRVLKYGAVTADNVLLDGSGGDPITSGFSQAFTYFEQESVSKHFKFIRTIFESVSNPSFMLTVATDFKSGGLALLGQPGVSTSTISQWDSGIWDTAVWSPPLTAWQTLVGVGDVGYSASLILKTRTTIETRYVAAHWVFETGTSL